MDDNEPRSPTPAEMVVLIHGIMMLMGGSVLAVWGWDDLEWFAIPAQEWHDGGWREEQYEPTDWEPGDSFNRSF